MWHIDANRSLSDHVQVKDIFVDESYTRSLKTKALSRMTGSWDRSKAGVIYLSLRDDGRFACLDGWHRVTACLNAEGPEASLPAMVWIDLSVREEAELFNAFNQDRQPLTPIELFKSRLRAGDPVIRDIYTIVQGVGWHIASKETMHRISGASALETSYRRLGHDLFARLMGTLAAGFADHDMVQAEIVVGLGHLYVRYPSIHDDVLIKLLLRLGTARIILKGKELHATTGMESGTACGFFMWQSYNRGVRKDKLGPWAEKTFSDITRAVISESAKESGARRRKVTDDQVRDIRRLHKEGMSNGAIGKRYDVSDSYVSLIVRKRMAAEVED